MTDISELLISIYNRLDELNIHELRPIGRCLGVCHPADGFKGRVVSDIMALASGKYLPYEVTGKGAPPKAADIDEKLLSDILECRTLSLAYKKEQGLSDDEWDDSAESYVEDDLDSMFAVASDANDEQRTSEEVYGVLDYDGGEWFIRIGENEAHLNRKFVAAYNLQLGDYIHCEVSSNQEGAFGVSNVLDVGGLPPAEAAKRMNFNELRPIATEKKFDLGENLACRVIDLFAPLGIGNRIAVFGEDGEQKTNLVKDILKAISKQNNTKIILLKLDSSYEEVEEYNNENYFTFASYFDSDLKTHKKAATLAFEFAKRQVEFHRNAVLVIDNVNSLCGVLCDKGANNGAELAEVKKYYAAAHNFKEGGSLTIISVVNVEGDSLSQAFASNVKKLSNTRIALTLNVRRSRVYPNLDLENTYSVNDNKLLSEKEGEASAYLRENFIGMEELLNKFKQTSSNGELCDCLKG